jgi:hypothetical protein
MAAKPPDSIKVENRYEMRPPNLSPYNRDVSPSSYDANIAFTKPAGSTKCNDFFSKSKAERTIKWEEEIEKKDPNMDTKTRLINKKRDQFKSSVDMYSLKKNLKMLNTQLDRNDYDPNEFLDETKEYDTTSNTLINSGMPGLSHLNST